MNNLQLFSNIQKKKSYLCVGLDSDMDKIPEHLKKLDRPVLEFNRQIVDVITSYSIHYTKLYEIGTAPFNLRINEIGCCCRINMDIP